MKNSLLGQRFSTARKSSAVWAFATLCAAILIAGFTPASAWAAEETPGIQLESNSVHFNMVECPICKEEVEHRQHPGHAYHADPSMAYIKFTASLDNLEEKIQAEQFFVDFGGDGVVNEQAVVLGTITAYGPGAWSSSGHSAGNVLSIVPRVAGRQDVLVQAYTGSWLDKRAFGAPAHLTLTTSVMPAPAITAPQSVEVLVGSTLEVLGGESGNNALLTPNESARIVERAHPQMILSVTSSNSQVVEVKKGFFESAVVPDGNPYTKYSLQCNKAGSSVIVVKDALGKTHRVTANVVKPASLAKAKVAVADRTWTGKKLAPSKVTVKVGGRTLRQGADYTVACKGGKKIGAYTVTIKGKGAYTGTKTAKFKIVPKGVAAKKPSAAKRGFTAKWKRPASKHLKQTTGYEVQWSTDKKFKKAVTSKFVKGAKKTSLKVTKLKPKKTYYVKVRAYKQVGKTKYYSSWSKVQKVKTKK